MQLAKYVSVRLIKGWQEALWYIVPERLKSCVATGSIVKIPLQKQSTYAVVIKVTDELPAHVKFELRELADMAVFPNDSLYDQFIKKLADFYFISPTKLYKRVLGFLEGANDSESKTNQLNEEIPPVVSTLTIEQQNAVDVIAPNILKPSFYPVLLHGVTGSGKTEVYKHLINTTIESGRTSIFMLPELSLCIRFEQIFRSQLSSDLIIYRFDSGNSVKHRHALWSHLSSGKPTLIIGVHLPVLLPIQNLGLIIVDEEHETGFIEKRHPKLHSREVAIWRAQQYKIPIILGSATPSIATLYRVIDKKFVHLKLTKRFAGKLPAISITSLKQKKRREQFWITPELDKAIAARLERREQVIIFLNRRGHSFLVQCSICGNIFECQNCSVSLTYHLNNCSELLCCHYCNFSIPMPETCSNCKASSRQFLKKGIGVQKLVSILKDRFPNCTILNPLSRSLDVDNIFNAFYRGEGDILVGTQIITKGLHFPRVTLVGVIWGDLDFNFPTFNARESALQQLIQVAGRAGRSALPGAEVIIQTLTDNPIFHQVSEEKYVDFCIQELEMRKELSYPPNGRLIQIELYDKDPILIDIESQQLAHDLEKYKHEHQLGVTILGPGKPMVHRIKNIEARQILLKAAHFSSCRSLIFGVDRSRFVSTIIVQPIF